MVTGRQLQTMLMYNLECIHLVKWIQWVNRKSCSTNTFITHNLDLQSYTSDLSGDGGWDTYSDNLQVVWMTAQLFHVAVVLIRLPKGI